MAKGGYNWGQFAGQLISSFTGKQRNRTVIASGPNQSGNTGTIFGGPTIQHAGIDSGGYVGTDTAIYVSLGMVAGACVFFAWYVWG